jgi:hypothetical protein
MAMAHGTAFLVQPSKYKRANHCLRQRFKNPFVRIKKALMWKLWANPEVNSKTFMGFIAAVFI